MINIDQKFTMEGFYSFKAINVNTGEERNLENIIAKDHKNMILDSGLDALGNSSICGGCKVGTGSTAVIATQTDLISTKATTTTIQSESVGRFASATYYVWGRRTFRFPQGAAAGNLTEVGVHGSSSTSLFSRALIVDSGGLPTTLTILSDEWLDVTYELRVYQDLSDKVFSLNLLGTEHTVTVRPASVQATPYLPSNSYFFSNMLAGYSSSSYQTSHFNGAIGAITASPSGTSNTVSTTFSNYVSKSYQHSVIFSSGLDVNNLSGGITSTYFQTYKCMWQMGYSPAILKDNFRTLVLTYTFSWGRHDPE